MSQRRGKQRREYRAPQPSKPAARVEPDHPRAAAQWRRILDRVLPLAIPTLFFLLVWILYPFHTVSEFDPDEGNNVIKALQLAKGHKLYTEIWSDQPPLFTYMLRGWLGLAGWSAHQARIFVLICSCVLLGALYQTVRPIWGHGGAIASAFLLATTWRYVALSVSAMLAIPTLMLAMLSACFIEQYRHRRHWLWLALSGAFLALSLFTKLFAIPLAPLLALAVAYIGWANRSPATSRVGWLRPLGLWLAGFAVTVAVLSVTMIPWSEIGQLIHPHLDAGQRMAGAGWDKVYAEQLRADWLYAVFGLIGIVHVVRRREWLALIPVVWYLLSAVALHRHRPLWYHHYLLLSVPMCWMAAAALGPLFSGEAFVYPGDFLAAVADVLWHLTLPALALGFTLAATVSRLSRSAMLEVVSQDYIRTARAKGQLERMVIYKHALRNMMVPLLTIIGIFVAIALTGTVLTETVFTRPGLGKMLVDAIGARDYPLAQGAITVFTMIIIAVNLVVDLLYAVVDPRITFR